jgi:hypothetical protein
MVKIQIENFSKKYKFVIIILLLIIITIFIWILNLKNNIDRNSYALLLKWSAIINNNILERDKRIKLKIGDIVRTVSNKALVVLEWWDGSVTRLWGNTTVKINNLYFSDDLDKVNISFELLNWKTWSTVISFLWKGSYFNETFNDSVAAVRWTIFDLDLSKNYLYVVNHQVEITNKKTNKKILIQEKKPFNIQTFNFIPLDIFIKSFKDKTWEALNYKIDKNLFNWLEKQIQKDLDNLIDISDLDINWILKNNKKKEELYLKVLKAYQQLNFVKSDNEELFKKKLELKNVLIKLSNNENKEYLLKNTFYDFNDIINKKEYWALNNLLVILNENSDLVNKLELDKAIDIKKIPKYIKSKLINIKSILINRIWKIENTDVKSILDSTDNLINKSIDSINNHFKNK